MAERLYRAQLLLQPSQHQRLREIAEREGKSISEVARGVIRRGLESMTADEQALQAQRTESLGKLDALREVIKEEYGVYEGSLIHDARKDHEKSLEPKNRRDE